MRLPLQRKRKVLCTIGAGPHEELLALTSESYRAFAERHGYELELRTTLPAPERAASWSKVRLVLELLERFEVVFWVDVDAMIVDPSRDVLDQLGRRSLLGLVAHEYRGQHIPNFGVFVARSGRATRLFLEQVWAQTQYLDHVWWENAAVLHLLGYELEPTVRLVRPSPMVRRIAWLGHEWNSVMDDPAEDPRIVHYAGHSQEARMEHLGRWRETMRERFTSV